MGFLDDIKAEKQKKVAENWFKFGERAEDPEKKVEYYTKSLEADPLNTSVWAAKEKVLEELGRAEEGEKYAKSWESKQSPGFISVTETPGFEETGLPEKKEKPEGGEEVFSGSTAQKRQGWNETSENSSSEKRERKIEEKPLRNQAPGKPYGLINLENEPAEMPVKTKELKEETETEMSGSKKLPEEGKNMKRDTGTNYGSMAEPERGTAQNRIHEYGSENYINIRISWGEAIKFWLAGVVAMFIVWLVFLTLFGSLIRTAMW